MSDLNIPLASAALRQLALSALREDVSELSNSRAIAYALIRIGDLLEPPRITVGMDLAKPGTEAVIFERVTPRGDDNR